MKDVNEQIQDYVLVWNKKINQSLNSIYKNSACDSID